MSARTEPLHDLRVELRKSINRASSDLGKLKERIEEAKTLRENVAAALGRFRSGETGEWLMQYDWDNQSIGALEKKVSSNHPDLENLRPEDLESRLIQIDEVQHQIDALLKRYQESIDFDNERARQHKEANSPGRTR